MNNTILEFPSENIVRELILRLRNIPTLQLHEARFQVDLDSEDSSIFIAIPEKSGFWRYANSGELHARVWYDLSRYLHTSSSFKYVHISMYDPEMDYTQPWLSIEIESIVELFKLIHSFPTD